MNKDTLYLVKEDTPNGRYTHQLKRRTAGELYGSFCANSAEECERWALANDYHVEYGAPKLPTRIDIAKKAWAAIGNYPLDKWETGKGDADYLIAWGYPPRARYEYVHVFVFMHRWLDKGYANVLVSVLRAPWHEKIRFRGASPDNRRHLYKYLEDDTYAML